jgi:hypothetical protein
VTRSRLELAHSQPDLSKTDEPRRPDSTAGAAAGPLPGGRFRLLIALLVLVAAALRLAAAQGDLVMDEIWSMLLGAETGSAWQIVALNHDNNHILNTLVMFWLGVDAPPLAHRLPAVLAGCLGLVLTARVAARNQAGGGLAVLVLVGFSHLAILYSSEARGYAYLMAATPAAWWALESYIERPRLSTACAFVGAVVLGFLAHLTFLFAYAGFFVYSAIHLLRRRNGFARLVTLHLIPLLTATLLYFLYVQGMRIGGGELAALVSTVIASLSLMGGGPQFGAAAYFTAAVTASLVAVAVAGEFRLNRPRGILYVTAIVGAPALILALRSHDFLYPRYFLVPMMFAYVAVGCQLARWFQASHAGRIGVVALLLAYLGCNLVPVVRLIELGRGQYTAAVRWLAEHTEGPIVEVGGDHDFRNPLVAQYHAALAPDRYAARGKRLVYLKVAQVPPAGTEWLMRHTFDGDSPLPVQLSDRFGVRYDLQEVFPAGSISGWTWWIYRRR